MGRKELLGVPPDWMSSAPGWITGRQLPSLCVACSGSWLGALPGWWSAATHAVWTKSRLRLQRDGTQRLVHEQSEQATLRSVPPVHSVGIDCLDCTLPSGSSSTRGRSSDSALRVSHVRSQVLAFCLVDLDLTSTVLSGAQRLTRLGLQAVIGATGVVAIQAEQHSPVPAV